MDVQEEKKKNGARRVCVPKSQKIKLCTVQDVLQLVLIDPLHPALFKVADQGIVLYCIVIIKLGFPAVYEYFIILVIPMLTVKGLFIRFIAVQLYCTSYNLVIIVEQEESRPWHLISMTCILYNHL